MIIGDHFKISILDYNPVLNYYSDVGAPTRRESISFSGKNKPDFQKTNAHPLSRSQI